jgi:hypothetical protein
LKTARINPLTAHRRSTAMQKDHPGLPTEDNERQPQDRPTPPDSKDRPGQGPNEMPEKKAPPSDDKFPGQPPKVYAE